MSDPSQFPNLIIEQFSDRHETLLIIKPNKDNSNDFLSKYLLDYGEQFKNLLAKHGALLFRGFSVNSSENFKDLAQSFSGQDLPKKYIGGNSPRDKISDGVYTSTYVPSNMVIPQHIEMSYTNRQPSFIMFACLKPAIQGGETPLTNCIDMFESLDEETKNYFSDIKLKFTNYFLSDDNILYKASKNTKVAKSWQEAFSTKDMSDIQEFCQINNAIFNKHLGKISISEIIPAVKIHPIKKSKYWYASLVPFYFREKQKGTGWGNYITYRVIDYFYTFPYTLSLSNGNKIPFEYQQKLKLAMQQNTFTFSWQQGDFLVLDNQQMAHGRNSFSGERQHLAILI